MVNLLLLGGIIAVPAVLVLVVLGIWAVAGRTIVSAFLGLASAALLVVLAGPRILLLFIAMLFMANDAEHRARNRPAPLPQLATYTKPANLPERISVGMHMDLEMTDGLGHTQEKGADLIVTVVYDPAASDGIGDGTLWTVTGAPLSYDLGGHQAVTIWDARKLLDICLQLDAYADYGALYDGILRKYGTCYRLSVLGLLAVDGSTKPREWPRAFRNSDMSVWTTGPVADPAPSVAQLKPATEATFVTR